MPDRVVEQDVDHDERAEPLLPVDHRHHRLGEVLVSIGSWMPSSALSVTVMMVPRNRREEGAVDNRDRPVIASFEEPTDLLVAPGVSPLVGRDEATLVVRP